MVTGRNVARTALLRTAAAGIAILGVLASLEMMLGSKLFMQPVLDMWDFRVQTPAFFANFACVIGLYAVVAHYGLKLITPPGSKYALARTQ